MKSKFEHFGAGNDEFQLGCCVAGIIDAIRRKQPVAYLPRRYFFAVVLKHFLPTKVYWLMHNFLKTHHGMDTFEGKKLIWRQLADLATQHNQNVVEISHSLSSTFLFKLFSWQRGPMADNIQRFNIFQIVGNFFAFLLLSWLLNWAFFSI